MLDLYLHNVHSVLSTGGPLASSGGKPPEDRGYLLFSTVFGVLITPKIPTECNCNRKQTLLLFPDLWPYSSAPQDREMMKLQKGGKPGRGRGGGD